MIFYLYPSPIYWKKRQNCYRLSNRKEMPPLMSNVRSSLYLNVFPDVNSSTPSDLKCHRLQYSNALSLLRFDAWLEESSNMQKHFVRWFVQSELRSKRPGICGTQRLNSRLRQLNLKKFQNANQILNRKDRLKRSEQKKRKKCTSD